jgi:hypothetical protein
MIERREARAKEDVAVSGAKPSQEGPPANERRGQT